MSHLWTADALVAALDGRPIGAMPEGVSGISIDSRTLQPGEAFFAIKGDAMDGHDFATAAIKAGAGVLIVAEGKLPALGRLTAPMIVVPDRFGVRLEDHFYITDTGAAWFTEPQPAIDDLG